MPVRHLIIGGGTAGMNAMRTIREEEREPSEITLVSAERPYSRMVLPYYLDRSIAESHVFTATASQPTVPAAGGDFTLTINSTAGCTFSVSAAPRWITLPTGSSGTCCIRRRSASNSMASAACG